MSLKWPNSGFMNGSSPAKFKRKVEEISWFPEGKVVLKQKGITGHTIKKTRVMRLWTGATKTEVTTDVYPATFEIYQVGPGTDPETLPPPPDGADAPASAPAAAATTPPVQIASSSPAPTTG